MRVGFFPEERQATAIAHGRGEASVNESLPVVRVEDDVPNGSLACDVGDSPIVAHSVARPALVLGERLTRRPDKPSVARHDDRGVG